MNHFSEEKPIFIQIADTIKDCIICESYKEETQIPSITEYSIIYKINPATALKGVNILVDEGLLYKKRGVGMFVAEGARTKLLQKRQELFYNNHIEPMITEANNLKITKNEIYEMLERGMENVNYNIKSK